MSLDKNERSYYSVPVSKGERTRSTILNVALAEASTVGLHGLSIGNLARKVALSKSGLFAHFGSKEVLQLEVLAQARELYVEIVVAPALKAPRGLARLEALFENWLSWSKASFLPGGCVFVASAIELDDVPGPLRDVLVESQRDWLGTLATAAEISVEEGHLGDELDVEQFAYEFHSLILSHHYFHRLLRDPKTEERCRVAFRSLLARSGAAPT